MAGQRSHASRQREPSTTTTTKQQQKQRVEQRVMGGEQLQVENRIEGGGLSGNGVVAAAAATTHARGGRCRRHRRCGAQDRLRGCGCEFDGMQEGSKKKIDGSVHGAAPHARWHLLFSLNLPGSPRTNIFHNIQFIIWLQALFHRDAPVFRRLTPSLEQRTLTVVTSPSPAALPHPSASLISPTQPLTAAPHAEPSQLAVQVRAPGNSSPEQYTPAAPTIAVPSQPAAPTNAPATTIEMQHSSPSAAPTPAPTDQAAHHQSAPRAVPSQPAACTTPAPTDQAAHHQSAPRAVPSQPAAPINVASQSAAHDTASQPATHVCLSRKLGVTDVDSFGGGARRYLHARS